MTTQEQQAGGQGGGEGVPGDPDWDALIAAATSRARPTITAQEHVESLQSASKPQKFRCEGSELYAVKFHGNPDGDGRAIFTEQVAGLLGKLIGAPVPEVRLVRVTAELLAPLNLGFNGVAAGLHHGSKWADGFSDRSDFIRYADRNRAELAALHLLYSWMYCTDDHQLIYRNTEPHDVLSVDHSRFLPGTTNWSAQTLASQQDNFQMDAQFGTVNLADNDYKATLDRIEAITSEDIADVVGTPPDEWGIPQADRIALAGYIAHRKVKLLTNFGRTAR